VARKQFRPFTQLLRLLQVDDSSDGPRISSDVQLTYQVQDVSELIAAIPPIRVYTFVAAPTNVARISGITVQPPADSAIFLEWLRNDTGGGTALQYRVGAEQLTNDLTITTPRFVTGGTRRSVITLGTRATVTAGVTLPDGENIPAQAGSIFVQPGQFLFFHAGPTIVNTAIIVSFSYREIPLP